MEDFMIIYTELYKREVNLTYVRQEYDLNSY